jgi:hypothetical protein
MKNPRMETISKTDFLEFFQKKSLGGVEKVSKTVFSKKKSLGGGLGLLERFWAPARQKTALTDQNTPTPTDTVHSHQLFFF